jgi:hypothetical protein
VRTFVTAGFCDLADSRRGPSLEEQATAWQGPRPVSQSYSGRPVISRRACSGSHSDAAAAQTTITGDFDDGKRDYERALVELRNAGDGIVLFRLAVEAARAADRDQPRLLLERRSATVAPENFVPREGREDGRACECPGAEHRIATPIARRRGRRGFAQCPGLSPRLRARDRSPRRTTAPGRAAGRIRTARRRRIRVPPRTRGATPPSRREHGLPPPRTLPR